MEKMVFYIDGEEETYVWIDPLQRGKVERMFAKAAKYAAHGGFNLQYKVES